MIPFSVLITARVVAVILFIMIVGVPILLPLLSDLPMFNKVLLGTGVLDWLLTLSPYIIAIAGLMHLPAFRLDKDEFADAIHKKKWSLLFNGPRSYGRQLHFRDAIHLNTKRSGMAPEKDRKVRWISVSVRGESDPKVSICFSRIFLVVCIFLIGIAGFLLPMVPDLIHRHYEIQPQWATGLGVFVEARWFIYLSAAIIMIPGLLGALRKVRSIRFNSKDNTVSVVTGRLFGFICKETTVVNKMSELHGLQIIDYRGKTLSKNRGYTRQYELNLVFKNSSRLHIHKLHVASAIRADAMKLGKSLKLPIWDHSQARYVLNPEARVSGRYQSVSA